MTRQVQARMSPIVPARIGSPGKRFSDRIVCKVSITGEPHQGTPHLRGVRAVHVLDLGARVVHQGFLYHSDTERLEGRTYTACVLTSRGA
jgi:hypothetical protein